MPVNPDGTLRPYNASEVASFKLKTREIRGGRNPVETYSPDGSGCERPMWCDWNLRTEAVKYLVGEVATWDDSGTQRITRTAPQSHPVFPKWICVKAVVAWGHKFIGDDSTTGGVGNKIPMYEQAALDTQWEQVPFRMASDSETYISPIGEMERYTTKPGHIGAEVTSGSSYTTMAGGSMTYKTADASPPHDVPVPFPIGFVDTEGKFGAIFHRIPEDWYKPGKPLFDLLHGDPVGGIRPWIGTANSTPLFGRPIATCVLEGVEPRLLPDPVGSSYSWDLKYVWLYRPQTHMRLPFFDAKGVISPGYRVVSKPGGAYHAPEDMSDDESLFSMRDHAAGLWKIS